jgi:glycosyltransferase involved in cell wall biosynthesis
MSDCNQLTIFNKVAEISPHDIFVITGNEPKLFPNLENLPLRKILKVIELAVCHANLGKAILNNKNRDAIIIHGFSTAFLTFTYFFSLFWAKNIFCLTHHNIQQAFQSPLMRLMLKMYHVLGYRFIVNETPSVLKNIGFSNQEIDQHLSLLHPVFRVASSSIFTSDKEIGQIGSNEIKKRKIGLVGKVRREKQFDKTLNLLLELQEKLDFLLIIGTDDLSPVDNMKLDGVKLLDTSTKDNYLSVLALCDVVVLNYEESNYYYRCSGVAADAIGVGSYVVCPSFPFMSHQLNYPNQVGILYNNESDLEMAIQQALELVPTSENTAFESHYATRSIENLALILTKDIESRIGLQ